MCSPYSGLINLGSGQGVTIKELVDVMARVTGKHFVFDPSQASGYPYRVLDTSLAREQLGFAPEVTLENGIAETWQRLQKGEST